MIYDEKRRGEKTAELLPHGGRGKRAECSVCGAHVRLVGKAPRDPSEILCPRCLGDDRPPA